MMPPMRKVGDILIALGGATEVARALGLSVTTVDSWRRFNRVPAWRRESIVKVARGLNVRIADNELRPAPRKVAA